MKIMNSQSIAKSNRDSSIFTSSDKFRNLTNKTLQEPESYWNITMKYKVQKYETEKTSILFILLPLCIFFTACSKENDNAPKQSENIIDLSREI